jgi:Mn2+/Fe2+ NRAMP family transporter
VSVVDAPAKPKNGRRARLPPWLKALLGLFAILGPGLISANAGNDAGGILTYASAGSQFGYRTLLLLVVITIALAVVQEMCARLGAYTGEGLGALIREFPLRSGATAIGAVIALLPGNLVELVINARVLNGFITPGAPHVHLDPTERSASPARSRWPRCSVCTGEW